MSGYINYISYTAGTTKGETTQGKTLNTPFALYNDRNATVPGKVDVNYTGAAVVENFTGTSGTAAWFPVYDGAATEAKAAIVSITTSGGAAVTVAADASVTVGTDGKTLTFSNGTGTTITSTDTVKVKYVYDNVVIPQNDLPIINVKMESIPLIAKARRIAVYYSQLAAFQAKTDYGFDMGDQLAEKAAGELAYKLLVA